MRRAETSRHAGAVARGTPARRPNDLQLPLAIGFLQNPDQVNAQLTSPLFSKLPGELRESVWSFALTPYEDLDNLYALDQRYARPGQTAPLRVAVGLLLTCRAIYIEAFLVPFQNIPIAIFDGDREDVPPPNPLQCTSTNWTQLRKLKPWQFAQISSVELTVQQVMLEGGAIERASRLVGGKSRHAGYEARNFTIAGYASFAEPKDLTSAQNLGDNENKALPMDNILVGKKITHLTIRMSRTDWWTWSTDPRYEQQDPSKRLRLEPMINTTLATFSAMGAGYQARRAGQDPDFELDDFEKQGRWGMHFAEFFPDLQTLELVLETFAPKQDQLESVVECAKLWTFPLKDGHHLRWNGKPESTIRWEGASRYHYGEYTAWIWNCSRREASRDENVQLWRQARESSDQPRRGQVFVMKTLVFERQRNSDYEPPSEV
ncbi:hypothetical protein F5X99DRAFT_88603 [Biscogniauxia marginata]|nr:hypothetical protein F5X99DRAFT_88603 [Biscogniauxia marginata]